MKAFIKDLINHYRTDEGKQTLSWLAGIAFLFFAILLLAYSMPETAYAQTTGVVEDKGWTDVCELAEKYTCRRQYRIQVNGEWRTVNAEYWHVVAIGQEIIVKERKK